MKINKIFMMLGAAAVFSLAACTDEVEYTPAQPYAGNGVYFPVDASQDVSIATDATTCSLIIERENAEGALTVNLEGQVTDNEGNPVEGIFSVPTQVTFPADEKSVPVVIGVDFAQVIPEYKYNLKLKILGEDNSPYGLTERNFILSYEPWTDWLPYRYYPETGAMVPLTHENYDKEGSAGNCVMTYSAMISGYATIPLWVRGSLVNSDRMQYLVPEPQSYFKGREDSDFDPLEDCDYYYIVTLDKSLSFDVDGTECYQVYLADIDTGETDDDGISIRMMDVYTWVDEEVNGGGVPRETVLRILANNNLENSYYNPQRGLFSIDIMLYPANMPGYRYGNAFEYIQLPGYKDYYVEMNYSGNFVDGYGQETAIVQSSKSEDVASYAYQIYAGALTDAEIQQYGEELKADTEAELVYEASTNLTFTLDEDGAYTVVYVGYDEGGEAVVVDGYTFEYASVQKSNDWKKLGYCRYYDGLVYGLFTSQATGDYFGGEDWDVEIEESLITPGIYRLKNVYQSWPLNVTAQSQGLSFTVDGVYYITINATNPEAVYVEESLSGLTFEPWGYAGNLTVTSMPASFISQGVTLDVIAQAGYCGTLKDGVITIPAGTLFMSNGVNFGTYTNYNEALLAATDDIASQEEFNNFWQNFRPIYGDGFFMVDLGNIASAPRKSASARGSVRNISDAVSATNFKATAPAKKVKSKAMSNKEIYGSKIGKARKMNF